MDNLLDAAEQVDFEYHQQLRQSLNRHAQYEIDQQHIRNFITNQVALVQVLRNLSRNRRLRSSTEAGRRIRQLRSTMVREIEVLEIAFTHLTNAHRRVEPNRCFIEGIINPSVENAGTIFEQSAAVDILNEFDTHYAAVNELWDTLLGHMPEVQYFARMDLR